MDTYAIQIEPLVDDTAITKFTDKVAANLWKDMAKQEGAGGARNVAQSLGDPEKAMKIPKALQGGVGDIFKDMGKNLLGGKGLDVKGLVSNLSMLDGEIGTMATAAGAAIPVVGQIGAAIGIVVGTVTAAVKAFNAFSDSVAGFVQAANPMIVEQYENVFKDMNAVIGRALIPTMQQLTQVYRTVADFVMAIMPSQGSLNQLYKAMQPLVEGFREKLTEWAPVIQHITSMTVIAVANLAKLANAISKAGDAANLAAGPSGWLSLTRKYLGGKQELPSSLGQHYQKAQYSNIGDLMRDSIAQAYGGGEDPQLAATKETRDYVKEAKEYLQDIADKLEDKARGFFGQAPKHSGGGDF